MLIDLVLPYPPTGEHLLATPWQHIFYLGGGKALSPGCGAYCSPAAAEIKPVRKAGDKGDCRATG